VQRAGLCAPLPRPTAVCARCPSPTAHASTHTRRKRSTRSSSGLSALAQSCRTSRVRQPSRPPTLDHWQAFPAVTPDRLVASRAGPAWDTARHSRSHRSALAGFCHPPSWRVSSPPPLGPPAVSSWRSRRLLPVLAAPSSTWAATASQCPLCLPRQHGRAKARRPAQASLLSLFSLRGPPSPCRPAPTRQPAGTCCRCPAETGSQPAQPAT
jgi:hypothetical protein